MLSSEEAKRQQSVNLILKKIEELPKSYQRNLQAETNFCDRDKADLKRRESVRHSKAPDLADIEDRLFFRTENYIEDVASEGLKARHDVVLCFSTAKYVQLNFGDLGIKTLFLKVHDTLAMDGLFILESQPWRSFKKDIKNEVRKALNDSGDTEMAQEGKKPSPGDDIELRPHMFKAYLKSIGFKLVHVVPVQANNGTAPGIQKPLYVY